MTVPPPFEARRIEMLVEVPRGSFVKRDAAGSLEFLSPVPCPFNYGSVPSLPAADGDALDAVLLGPRLAAGQTISTEVQAVMRFLDDGQQDDKLICASTRLSTAQMGLVLVFFHFYALCKLVMNRARGRTGRTRCLGWGDPAQTLQSASRA